MAGLNPKMAITTTAMTDSTESAKPGQQATNASPSGAGKANASRSSTSSTDSPTHFGLYPHELFLLALIAIVGFLFVMNYFTMKLMGKG